jgi:hypothetical protein
VNDKVSWPLATAPFTVLVGVLFEFSERRPSTASPLMVSTMAGDWHQASVLPLPR